MKIRILLLLEVVIFLAGCSWQKNTINRQIKSPFIEKDKRLVFKNLVTNRDYIIYLYWLELVYGESYPAQVLNALPEPDKIDAQNLRLLYQDYDQCRNPDVQSKASSFYVCDNHEYCNSYTNFVAFLLDEASPFLRNYVSNPAYLDYPMTGLNPTQIYEMGKWMTDRYNEHTLIKYGYLNPNNEQKDEDNFVTEAYVVEQYQGNVRKTLVCYDDKERISISWKQQIFLPLFHPSDTMLLSLDKPLFRAYPPHRHYFLKTWEELLHITYPNSKKAVVKDRKESQSTSLEHTIEELFLPDFYKNCPTKVVNIDSILTNKNDYPWEEKDSLGRMPFVIIANHADSLPVVVEEACLRQQWEDLGQKSHYVFRFEVRVEK